MIYSRKIRSGSRVREPPGVRGLGMAAIQNFSVGALRESQYRTIAISRSSEPITAQQSGLDTLDLLAPEAVRETLRMLQMLRSIALANQD